MVEVQSHNNLLAVVDCLSSSLISSMLICVIFPHLHFVLPAHCHVLFFFFLQLEERPNEEVFQSFLLLVAACKCQNCFVQ